MLLFVHIPTHFKEIFRVAKAINQSEQYNALIWFNAPYTGVSADMELAAANHIQTVEAFGDDSFLVKKSVDNPKPQPKLKAEPKPKRRLKLPKLKLPKLKLRFKPRTKPTLESKIKAGRVYKHLSQRRSLRWLKSIYGNARSRIKPVRTRPLRPVANVPKKERKPKRPLFIRIINLVKFIYSSQSKSWITTWAKRLGKVVLDLVNKESAIENTIYKRIKRILSLVFKLPVMMLRLLMVSAYRLMWTYNYTEPFAISSNAKTYHQSIPSLLKRYNIKLMVFPEHNLFYLTQMVTYLARKEKIPAIIVPFTIANTIEWSEAFYHEPQRNVSHSLLNHIGAILFPHWVHQYKDRKLILPHELILIHEMFRITPKHPWLLNSGDIDFLAVESEAMKDYYTAAGIESKRLRAVGALYNDDLFIKIQHAETSKKELYDSLGYKDNKPLILCALPPDQLASRADCTDFDDYEAIVRFLMSELSRFADDYHVVINLHPRITPDSVSYINEYPVTISNNNITDLIPLCSVYLASCSATIRMAISCAIPVINYDLYRYNYDDYTSVTGVITMTEKDAFAECMYKMMQDCNYYDEIKSAQLMESEKWGKPDGMAGAKLLKEIDLLLT